MTKLPNTIKSSKGFTLIELLVVIAIIGILAGALFVAINPGARIKQANVSAAQNAVTGYANKIEAYAADTTAGSGVYPLDPSSPPAGSIGAIPTTGGYTYGYQGFKTGGTNCTTDTPSTGDCARF